MSDEPFIAEPDTKTPKEVMEAISKIIESAQKTDTPIFTGFALNLSGRDATAIGAALTLVLAKTADDPDLTTKMLGLVKLASSPVEVIRLAQTFFDFALAVFSEKDSIPTPKTQTDLLAEFLRNRQAEKQAARERPDYPSSSAEGAD